MTIESGTEIGRYRVVRLLAQGGMAEVYRADQALTGGIYRPAALKVIRPELSGSNDFREMFLDEARTACTLSHPNIVHIYEVGETDDRLYMAMELVPGESLAAVVRRLREEGQRLPDEAILAVGIATCSALEAVHALQLPGEGHLNLVHRDVSPHNLLLGPSGSLKLIDFGIAKAATNRNLTLPGVTKGKAGYFSPEQAMGKSLDGRSDLFSLGVTLYKLASGRTPFDEHKTHQTRNTALVHGRWEPLAQVSPGLPKRLYEVVDRALAVKREDRFADAQEMREALEAVAFEAGIQVGQSSLAGYAQVADGEEPSVSGSRPSPTRSGSHSSRRNVPRPVQTSVSGSRSLRTRRVLIGVVAGSLIASGALVSWRLGGAPEEASPVAEVRDPAAAAGSASASPEAPGVGSAGAPLDSSASAETVADDVNVKVVPTTRAVLDEELAALVPPPANAAPEKSTSVPIERPELEAMLAHKPASAEKKPVRRARPQPKVVAASGAVPAAPEEQGEGELRIGSSPAAQVKVGGKVRGETPAILTLPAGSHSIELVPKSGGKASCSVKLAANGSARLTYDFSEGRCRFTQL